MGCCQDKDLQLEQRDNRSDDADGEDAARGRRDTAGLEGDVDAPGEKPRTSTDSVLITVLWRRLSMFSRRGSTRRGSGSTRSTRSHRQSVQSQRLGVALHEMNPEGILEESSEKG